MPSLLGHRRTFDELPNLEAGASSRSCKMSGILVVGANARAREVKKQRGSYIIHVYGHQPMVLSANKQQESVLICRACSHVSPTFYVPFCTMSRKKQSEAYRITEPGVVTHAIARKVWLDRGDISDPPRQVTMSPKKKSDISDSAASALLCRKKQSDISDSEVKGHHTRKPGASFS